MSKISNSNEIFYMLFGCGGHELAVELFFEYFPRIFVGRLMAELSKELSNRYCDSLSIRISSPRAPPRTHQVHVDFYLSKICPFLAG